MLNFNRPFQLARVVVLALVFTFFPLPVLTQGPAQAPVAPPYQWPRSRDYDVQHYRIVINRFDWTKRSITGETTITLRPFTNGVREIPLDAGNMTIHSVTLGTGAPLRFRYDNNEKLHVALDRVYPTSQDVSITINYTATPQDGMTFVTPNESEPDRPYQIWTAGQPESNHHWFPCYDYPNDRASSELIATAEDKYRVISNGQLVGVKADATTKTKTWHWKLDKPFSSYLVSLVVGEYAEVKDMFKNIPVVSYVYPHQVEEGRLSFGKFAKMVAFFSDKFGYDYPYAQCAQVMVRGFPGALENISVTTMTDTAVRDQRALLDGSSDGIVSHELAHQWFGDMITCRDWGEIWLNESFATFLSAVWTEHDNGKDAYLYEMLGNQQAYFQAWNRGNKRPIVTKRYDDPGNMFDTHSYPHGAAVLNMLRFVLGDEPFWKAIQHYTRKHAWQNVETQQLVIAIEEATGQNVQWFFDQRVYKMGHPEFEITSNYDESAKTLKLTVKQTQKPDDKRPWFSSPEFITTPVDIAVTTASGEKIHRVWIDAREKEFVFPVDAKPLITNFDRGNYLIKEVKFDRPDDELAYQLLHDNDVMGRVRAAIELKSRKGDAAAKALAEAAQRDTFWAVRLEATRALTEWKSDAARAALIDIAKDNQARVRRAALQGLGAFKDPKLADLFINVINTEQSYQAVAEAARALGQTGAPGAYNVLMDLTKQDSWQEVIRGGALEGLAALKDPRALDLALQYAAAGNRASVRRAAIPLLGDLGKGDDRAFNTLMAVFSEATRNRSMQLGFAGVQALGALGDARAIPALEEAMKSGNLPSFAKQALNGAINRIKKANEAGGEKKE